MESFDIIVVGSGSGLEVSSDADSVGMSVALVEEGPFGGTCLNRGCIPSKMLIHCADVMQTIQTAHLFGIKATVEGIDWDHIISRTYDEIDSDARNIEEGNRQADNITVYKGTGRFVGDKTMEVNGEQIRGETIVIAAGTRPWIPDIPGLKDAPYLTSDEALRLPSLPRRLAIIGGGYIAAELAHFFGALGSQVTIIHRRPTLLRGEDLQVAERFTEIYRKRFDMILGGQVSEVSTQDGEINLDVDVGGTSRMVVADALLVATSRVPNTDLMEVAKAGVKVNDRGYVVTDEFMETNVPGIWALGDIAGRYLLKHSANLEAAHVSNNILNPDHKVPVDYHAMPHAIFASPQIGSVGITEQEAQENNVDYVVAIYEYQNTAYGASIEDRDGFVKVLATPDREELLGCHIIGTDASMLIQEAVNLMRFHLPLDAITESIYVHPALPEVVQRAFASL